MSAVETITQRMQAVQQNIAAKKQHVSIHQLRVWRKQVKKYQWVLKNKINANTHQHIAG